MALAVADRRKELAPDELVIAPPQGAVGGPVVREDEDVPDLVDEPRAQEPREIAGCRRVEAGRRDRRIVEPRPPEVLESLRVQVQQVRCPLTRFYQWQQNVHGYRGPNPAGELKFFIGKQPSKRARKRDLQWFRQGEARTLLAACQALKPRWLAFLMVCFGGGLRWGEATALACQDIDWARARVHVARTWSEGGGRIEACKDGEDRWVKLPPATMWTPAARQLVFPNTVGRITRHGAFLELVWQPLLAAAKLPYRKPHAMRHSYATWMLEAGADLRWVKDQLGHASIEETEGTYGHLERERHERRVDLDVMLGGVQPRPPASTLLDAGGAIEGHLRATSGEDFMVEGKGFEPSTSALRTPRSPN